VMELEQDLKVANVICMVISCETCPFWLVWYLWISWALGLTIGSMFQNGRRHITSSKNEVSRDLVVNVKSKKKQALLVGACSYILLFCSIYLKALWLFLNPSL
jgi:syndetin